jgi:hypothetical protein
VALNLRGQSRKSHSWWIKQNPHRLFLDPRCETRFPLEIPREACFYRIAVAREAEDYARALGKTGLVIDPSIIGRAHYADNCEPFRVGQLDTAKGFVHVFGR